MKNFFVTLFVLYFTFNTFAFAKVNYDHDCQNNSQLRDEMQFYKNYAEQVKKERATVFNALLLSDEQIESKNKLSKEFSPLLEEKYKQLSMQIKKLNELKTQKASKKIINSQEKLVNSLKKDLQNIIDNENKQIKKILDKEQKAKLKMIQKLQKKSIKDLDKQKNYYKSNPKMRPFAYPHKCNCLQ